MDIKIALQQILDGHNLNSMDMRSVMRTIMGGEATSAQISGFLIALRCKGESIDEIAAATEVMRELATRVTVNGPHIIDTCGTGGDGANTFNISTTAAIVVAAAGGQVAKHGNRSVSSRSGSADVLEAAGVNLELSPDQVAQCVSEIGVGFLFAPKYHGAMKYTIAPRREMGVRTLFNLLGPLSNPAGAPNQLIGVFSQQWLEPLANVLAKLGSKHVLVVHAEDGLDEISIGAKSHVAELHNGEITRYTITPEQFGFTIADLSKLAVDSAEDSLRVLHSVLDNTAGPARDIVQLNAGAAIYAANISRSLADGIDIAQQVLADGSAKQKLADLISVSRRLKTG